MAKLSSIIVLILILTTGNLNASLIACWNFEDGVGSTIALDTSGYSPAADGTLAVGTSIVSDASRGLVLQTDGVSGHVVNCGTVAKLSPTTQLTLMAWIKPTGNQTAWLMVAGKGGTGYRMFQQTTGTICIIDTSASLWPNNYAEGGWGTITPNNWYHLAMTYSGSQLIVYINGQQVGINNVINGTINQTSDPFTIGGLLSSSAYPGRVDDVGLWDEALPAGSLDGSQIGTINYYRIHGISAQTVPPATPSSITYPTSSTSGQYTVSWASSNGATSYQLERSSDGTSTWTQILSGLNISYSENVSDGIYYYRVKATNSVGSSGWRTGASGCAVNITNVPPPTPASISYPTSSTNGKYMVGWALSTGATSYKLERSANNGSTWTQIYSDPGGTYSETITNGSYKYRVKASNGSASSGWRTGASNCAVNIPAPSSSLLGDINKDGYVNSVDMNVLSDHWLNDCAIVDCANSNIDNVNNIVDFGDYSKLAFDWFKWDNGGPTVVLDRLLDIPTFKTGSTWLTRFGYQNYHPYPLMLADFAAKGTKIYDFPSTATVWPNGQPATWTGLNTWDYSTVDLYFSRVRSADADALILPRLYMQTPDWWMNSNPNELEIVDNGSTRSTKYSDNSGPYASLASIKWRQDMGRAIENYIDHVKAAGYIDMLAGFELSGLMTEEWYHWSSGKTELSGYSNPTRDAFRNWLRTKYNNDVNNLRAAWGSRFSTITFDTVEVPVYSDRTYGSSTMTFRNPSNYMNVIDWERFYNELIPETIDYFAGVIKKKTGNTKLVGAFYAYMYEFLGNPEFGHNAFKKFNESTNLDYVFITPSYSFRGLGGGDYQRSPALSARLHGKLWYMSNDLATVKTKEILQRWGWSDSSINSELTRLGYTDTIQKNIWMIRRMAGCLICNGMYQSFFDLYGDTLGGHYSDASLMNEVSNIHQLCDRSQNYERTSISQILIVSDETSCSYPTYMRWDNKLLSTSLFNPQINLLKMGAPADHILIDDIGLVNASQYKLVVFLNCWNMTNAQRALVDSLKNSGRTLVFCYAAGYFNDVNFSAANMQTVSGITMEVDSDETLRSAQVTVTNDHPLGMAMINAGVTSFGPSSATCKNIWTSDAGAVRLGYNPSSTSRNTMAIKDMGTWKSIYCVTADMPAAAYRELARYAGVLIYNEAADTFYANKSYVCIHPGSSGNRTITFQQNVNVYDALTEQLLASNVTSYTRAYQLGETMIYRYEILP